MTLLSRFQELPQPDDELSSIASNLQHVLGARSQFGAAISGYGLGQFYAHEDGEHALRVLLSEILANVERHEPRLSRCVLQTAGRALDLSLRLLLSGQVAGRRATFLIHWNPVYAEARVQVLGSAEDDEVADA